MDKLTNVAAVQWFRNLAAAYTENKDFLTELDRVIGDSDHGINMARGFEAVIPKVEPLESSDLGTIFKTAAMTLISTVGGASGPLYGTFFLQLSMKTAGQNEIDEPTLAVALKAGLDGIMNRGKAVVGDKTMIDAMTPAVEVFAAGGNIVETARKAAEAARAGADSTLPLVARKGRASYLGERSAGHMDPGAESTFILFDRLSKALGA